MTFKTLTLALAAGIATFLVVAVAVTELLAGRIEFSLFVGLPAGLLAGAVAAALVALGLETDAPPERHRIAMAAGGFGAAFLLVLALGAGLFDVGTVLALALAAIVALLVAVTTYVRGQVSLPRELA